METLLGDNRNWNASTSSESYDPCVCKTMAIKVDPTDKMAKESWVKLTIRHAREEAVEELVNRLREVPGPIYHSELKQIVEEMGYKY